MKTEKTEVITGDNSHVMNKYMGTNDKFIPVTVMTPNEVESNKDVMKNMYDYRTAINTGLVNGDLYTWVFLEDNYKLVMVIEHEFETNNLTTIILDATK